LTISGSDAQRQPPPNHSAAERYSQTSDAGSRPNAHTTSYQVQDRSHSCSSVDCVATAWRCAGGPTLADAVARRHAVAHSTRVARRGAVRRRLSALELMRTLALYPPQPNTPSLPPFAPHRPNLRLTCVYTYIRLRLRLRLRLLGLPHGCLHTRPHPCPRLRLHPRVPIVCLWLYAYAYAVVAAPLPPPPPPPPPPPRPRRPPAAAEPPHHRFHRRHRRLRGRLPRHCLWSPHDYATNLFLETKYSNFVPVVATA
jgi:hypothetical protein